MAARTTFVGRSRELAALDDLAGAPLVTIWGPGGAGKTALARTWGRERPNVVWADLAAARTELEVVSTVAAALGVSLESGSDAIERVARAASAQKVLLVADNAEQLDDAGRGVLGRIAGGCSVLVTSRSLLGLASERAIEIGPLPETDAIALYATLSGMDVDDAARVIVRRLDAIPLAIELAAARAPVLGNPELLARLDRKLDVLGDRQREPRHATLRAAIAWSWELLDEVDRAALARCAMFESAFDASLAEAANADLDALERLRQRALVHVGPPDEAGRPQLYLLEAVRDFVRAQGAAVDPSEHRAAIVARTEPLAAIVRRGGLVDPALTRRRADLLAASLAEIESRVTPGAVQTAPVTDAGAVQTAPVTAESATLALAALLSVTGPLDLLLERLEKALRPGVDPRLVLVRGEVLRAMGRLEEAAAAANELLGSATGLLEADALRLAGAVARSGGDAPRAIELLTRALDRYRELDERALAGICLGEIGAAHQTQGKLDLAASRHAEAIAVHIAEKSIRAEGVERSFLAVATHRSGAPSTAIPLHEAALAIHRRAGHRRLEGAELLHLAFCHHELGLPERARTAFAEARHLLAGAGARGLEALAIILLARLDRDEGDLVAAKIGLAEAANAAPPGWARLEATRLVVTGHLLVETDPAAAARAYEAALGASRAVEVGFEALTPAYLAVALDRAGAGAAARAKALQTARALVSRVENPFIAEALAILEGRSTTASERAIASSSEVRRALAFTGKRRALCIEDDARRVVLPDGREIDLSRRKSVRLVLLALARARREHPGVPLAADALIAAGWPDERMSATAATKRLHTAIWTLRNLGFETIVVWSEEGYVLDPSIGLSLR